MPAYARWLCPRDIGEIGMEYNYDINSYAAQHILTLYAALFCSNKRIASLVLSVYCFLLVDSELEDKKQGVKGYFGNKTMIAESIGVEKKNVEKAMKVLEELEWVVKNENRAIMVTYYVVSPETAMKLGEKKAYELTFSPLW